MINLVLWFAILANITHINHAESPVPDSTITDQEVEAVVTNLFDAMRASDGDQIRSLITDQATLQTVSLDENEPVLRKTDFKNFISSIGQTEPGTLDEQLKNLHIHTDENLATAWMEYRFYIQDEFSHCGVNTMNLLKTSSGWKIFSIVDTRRRQGC